MKNELNVKENLWDWGHFHAAMEGTLPLSFTEVSGLQLDHKVVQGAILSYQQFWSEHVDLNCVRFHGRICHFDGLWGPATAAVMHDRFCNAPDYYYDDDGFLIEKANWPDSCREQLTVSYNFDGMNLSDDQILQAWQKALASWEAVIDVKFQIQDVFSRDHRIWATDSPLPGGTIAWSMLATSRCSSRLQQRYDTLPTWSVTLLQKVIAHEVGHALGARHVQNRAAIMYPSVGAVLVPGSADVAQMKRLGYSDEPVRPPDPPPTPPIPPNGPSIEIPDGHIDIKVDGKLIKLKVIERAF